MTGTRRSIQPIRNTSNGHNGSLSVSIIPGSMKNFRKEDRFLNCRFLKNIKNQGKAEITKYIDSKRLAYYDNAQVWWCPHCRIVCANEEVLTDGSHEKCGNRVEKKNLKQWMLRIPLYAERLLKGIDNLDWPEGIKDMQRNWIGRSTGAEVDFKIDGLDEKLTVFTTRPDTLFGATYMVIAPEHPLAECNYNRRA